jgi:hypothetical protein
VRNTRTTRSPYARPAADLARDLAAGLAAGRERLEQIARNPNQPKINGWHAALHACDYNLDWFQIGTSTTRPGSSPTETPPTWRGRWSPAGAVGNHGYEAAYYIVFEEGQGDQLNGANRYRLQDMAGFLAAPSNDQNLWMALGGDVKERAPSRGRSESP